MNANAPQKVLTSLIVAVVLVACGGGGGSTTVAGIDRTGTPTASFGTLTSVAAGSVTVNGVSFNTNAATFTVDGVAGTQSDLGIGDVVLVQGELDAAGTTATADTVIFNDVVDGVIFGIDRTGGLLTVLNQMVKVNAETTFSSVPNDSLDGLNIGDTIEVAGFETANAQIAATRVLLKPVGSEFEVTGVVSNLDPANSRFMINALVVDFSAAQLRDFDSGAIAEGDRVEAKGANLSPGNELLATSVEFRGDVISGDRGDRLEVEGFITRFASATDFDVATQVVSTDAQTTFTGGVVGDLSLNVKVEAEGNLDASGVLVATKIDIRRAKAVRIVANVDSVDSANDRLVVLGIDVGVDELTRVEDKSNADVDPLMLADINAGDYVEVRGAEDPASSADVIAAILEREDSDTEAILQGFVIAVSDPTLTILGVTIETNGTTLFSDATNNPLTPADFFSQVAPGSLVKAKGTESSATVIMATEVEFELE